MSAMSFSRLLADSRRISAELWPSVFKLMRAEHQLIQQLAHSRRCILAARAGQQFKLSANPGYFGVDGRLGFCQRLGGTYQPEFSLRLRQPMLSRAEPRPMQRPSALMSGSSSLEESELPAAIQPAPVACGHHGENDNRRHRQSRRHTQTAHYGVSSRLVTGTSLPNSVNHCHDHFVQTLVIARTVLQTHAGKIDRLRSLKGIQETLAGEICTCFESHDGQSPGHIPFKRDKSGRSIRVERVQCREVFGYKRRVRVIGCRYHLCNKDTGPLSSPSSRDNALPPTNETAMNRGSMFIRSREIALATG